MQESRQGAPGRGEAAIQGDADFMEIRLSGHGLQHVGIAPQEAKKPAVKGLLRVIFWSLN
jgi:hypothetical protein